jgi:hypothetical protein
MSQFSSFSVVSSSDSHLHLLKSLGACQQCETPLVLQGWAFIKKVIKVEITKVDFKVHNHGSQNKSNNQFQYRY